MCACVQKGEWLKKGLILKGKGVKERDVARYFVYIRMTAFFILFPFPLSGFPFDDGVGRQILGRRIFWHGK